MDLKMKGFQTNKQSIYIDCKQLLRRLYRLRFKVAKRHRDSLFDKCLFPALLGMIRHFRRAYRFRDERVKELDKFLFSFEDFNSWVIGFLCWQNAMGLYINEVTNWLQSFDFLRVVVFVDDIYIVTSDKKKALALMPELRSRLGALKVSLNESKFYCQHYSKGIMCLGTMLKFDRMYAANNIVKNSVKRFSALRAEKPLRVSLPKMLASVNSTLGIFAHKTMRKTVSALCGIVERRVGRFLERNPENNSFLIRAQFKINRLRRAA